jgi:hypothetical protein
MLLSVLDCLLLDTLADSRGVRLLSVVASVSLRSFLMEDRANFTAANMMKTLNEEKSERVS